MSAKLYQKCEQCNGTREIYHEARCPYCNGTGLWEIGLTMGQVEALQDDRDRLLVALDDAKREAGDYTPTAVAIALHGRSAEVWDARRRLAPGTEGKP